jgi:replicative DNA helicase
VTEVSEISRALKIMAKELNVPVLCCAHLSARRTAQRQAAHALRSAGIRRHRAGRGRGAFLYRDDYYNKDTEDPNTAECIIAKNRHGATGSIKLAWLGQYTTFASRDNIHDTADEARLFIKNKLSFRAPADSQRTFRAEPTAWRFCG